MIDHSFRSHFTEPFSSFILPMTESHLRDTLLSADLQASTPHHPTTATIYTDPPATHHGHFFPTTRCPTWPHQPHINQSYSSSTGCFAPSQHWSTTYNITPLSKTPLPRCPHLSTHQPIQTLQLRNTLRHLINTTHEAQRGLNILQFLPGSPGSPGH